MGDIQWLEANKLSINTLKIEFMLFGSSKHLKDMTTLIVLHMGDKLIRRMRKVKYFGVIPDEQLTWGTIFTIFQLKLSEVLVLSKG